MKNLYLNCQTLPNIKNEDHTELVENEGRLEFCRPYQLRDIRKAAIALGALLPERSSAREL